MADDKKQTNNSQSWTSSISNKGEFKRRESAFRNWITADGSSGFKAEKDRYHLYVSLACPWAHRTLIVRKLKGLEEVLPYTVVDWLLGENGWNFTDQKPKCTLDPVNGAKYLREIYFKADPNYDRNFTVPVVWDKKTNTIVNNESSEIIRMLNSEFNEFCGTPAQKEMDLYPEALHSEIDEVNSWIYPKINNGVYRAGFARSQEAYDEGVKDVFEGLDRVEEILSKKRYLTGNSITEADIRLLTTLLRFDTVYVGHFKCNKKRIIDYPNIWGYVRDLYATDGISETVDQEHIQKHYQASHRSINPHGIVAIGPDIDFNAPHDREKLSK
ncbi:Glutathione S-transferase omega-like 2 [Holothuria leucospilota]|uniref:Glutathione S-transferase omega-like 2 n=1 Tax=Holothuria leucospilota TaxID=206669 RepID=A0A9Q1BIL6_HOLLE|nr:Glutathione S-transferase omega-like 2 [Holothuria leucospilota]